MSYLWILFVFLICLAGIDSKTSLSREKDINVCCIPENWEGLLYLDYGIVFIYQNTTFSYINGSVHAAYSYTKKKVFFNITGVEQSPLIPKPAPADAVLLYDFEKMKMYTLTNGECQKSSLVGNMTHQCIPHDAKMIATGVFGSGSTSRLLHTYQFTTKIDIHYGITATVFKNELTPVQPKECDPFYVNYFNPSENPGIGSIYGLQFMDIGAIKSEKIFDIPQPCLNI